MNSDDVRTWKNAEPFIPFRIVMAGGEAFHVSDPECVWINPFNTSKRIAYVVLPDGGTIRLDLKHAERIEKLETGAA